MTNPPAAPDSPDLVVVGSGPGGYVAAIRAAQLGMKTAIIERESLGGICLNWGCIPTKALLKSAEVYEQLSHLGDYGLSCAGAGFDFPAVIERSRNVAKQLNAGVAFLMKKNGVEVIRGTARLAKGVSAPTVIVDLSAGGTRSLAPRSVILATGARARVVPSAGMVPDGERIWTYREAMTPKVLPKSLIVIGSGAIGIEFASFYRAFGSEVTVVEAASRILPVEDAEISAAAQKSFEKRGLRFRTGVQVLRVLRGVSGVTVDLGSKDKPEQLQAEVALIAIGIDGNVEHLGLEALNVKIDRGHVMIDSHCATNVAGLYAIGDVAGAPWLAHKASHEGVHCVERIAKRTTQAPYSPIPGCTYSQPQVASVGLTEAQAREAGHEIKVGRFPLRANGKAIAAGQTDGFVKTVFSTRTGQLLGAHMIGADVTEMIQGYVTAMTLESTEAELMGAIYPHPTLSESMHESVLDAYGMVLHI